jgi:hypothetical protein
VLLIGDVHISGVIHGHIGETGQFRLVSRSSISRVRRR